MKRPAALLLAIALLAPAAAPRADTAGGNATDDLAAVDRVVVRKSERRMYLYREGRPVRSYKVSLGLSPTGPKEREGDFRTPEGRYALTRRNPHSDYFLSIQVSYPGPQDVENARRNGWKPGGAIMVHGLPNAPRYPRERYLANDWTDGCVALSNDDMLEFWLLTQSNTPIEIQP